MKCGKQTYKLEKVVTIEEVFSLGGPLEQDGNFRSYFDLTMEDDEWSCKTHEKAEIKMQKDSIKGLLEKSKLNESDIDCIMGGDLINQLFPTNFSAREYEIPFCGLYNACATFGEALGLASFLLENQFEKIICVTSSHFATAERQYRFPLELGTQPTPESQWTVTGCGVALLTNERSRKPQIKYVTLGKIVDLMCSDANNMGAAMAPAAYDTIVGHLKDLGRNADYYDMILTGDLGKFGREALYFLCKKDGIILNNLNDCGAMIFKKEQKMGQGGSGAGCSSLSFCSYFYKQMLERSLKRILFVPTGALLSKDSPLQGETIPAIAHAIAIEMED
ncbi:MAG: stage V sporulation protein AD [Clostridia bacterium]